MYYWENVIKGKNYLGEKVHEIFPLAQQEVNNLVKDLIDKGATGEIYIFGSAITPIMNPWSDIDIAYNTSIRPTYFSLDYSFDKIDLKDEDCLNNPLYNEIRKGVKIKIGNIT